MDEIFKKFLVQMTEREKKQEERDKIYQEQQEERIRLQEERDKAKDESIKQLADQVKLLTERQNGTPATAANVRSNAEVRADKLSQLNQSLRKSVRVKEYKQSSQENIKEWLSKYEDEMYGLLNRK